MFRKQSFWKGSELLLASAMIAKLLGACFKIPLTNVLGGTGMGYFSTAYGLLLPVYALSVTGLSAAVAQTVSRAAALEHWAEVRRIRDTARLACGVLGLFLSLCMFLLAEPFAALVAAQPYALFSLLAIAPAALFGCLTAVERGYWEGLQNMTPTAVSQALEAVAKLGLGLALEAFEGGIKKDYATFSYFFVTSGLASFVLIAAGIAMRRLNVRFSALVKCGQNPMVAYTAAGFLIMPLLTLLHLSPCLQAFNELCPWMGVARGVLVTAAVMAVTVFFTNRRLFWRT